MLVKFSEPRYGNDGEDKIIASGLTLAMRLQNTPVGGGKFSLSDYNELAMRLQNTPVGGGKISLSDSNELAQLAHKLKEGRGSYSGSTFSAVLWAAKNFLGGYSIEVGSRYILSPDGTRSKL